MKKVLLIAIFSFLFTYSSKALHIAGGDVTVIFDGIDAMGNNQYVIQFRVFGDLSNLGGNVASVPGVIDFGIYALDNNPLNVITGLQATEFTGSAIVEVAPTPCFDVDPSNIDIEVFTFRSPPISIPPNDSGYVVQTALFARNARIQNLQGASGAGISLISIIADPALGQNSTPDFGDYPNPPVFCSGSTRRFRFPVTEPDGDSLHYSLVYALNGSSGGTTSNTQPPSTTYPYYPRVAFASGFGSPLQLSIDDPVGGTSPMTIDPATGEITTHSVPEGIYAFAVRVEEFRNGAKIGEVRRDLEFISTLCANDIPAEFASPFIDPVTSLETDIRVININEETCVDFVFQDPDDRDSLILNITSPIFDRGASFPTLDPVPQTSPELFLYTFNNGTESVLIPENSIVGTDSVANIATVAQRLCWTPSCNDISTSLYPITASVTSFGCSGVNVTNFDVSFLVVDPGNNTQVFLNDIANNDTLLIELDQESCFDLVFDDVDDDTITMEITSSIFNRGASFPTLDPVPGSSPELFLYTFNNGTESVLIPENSTISSNSFSNEGTVAQRFCWTPSCDDLDENLYSMEVQSSTDICGGLSLENNVTFFLMVNISESRLDIIPNVFTPNDDGVNDLFRIGGVSSPCDQQEEEFIIEIYNRWGLKVFESNDPSFAWDGKSNGSSDAPEGTYFVIVSGTFAGEKILQEKRTVTLLRN